MYEKFHVPFKIFLHAAAKPQTSKKQNGVRRWTPPPPKEVYLPIDGEARALVLVRALLALPCHGCIDGKLAFALRSDRWRGDSKRRVGERT